MMANNVTYRTKCMPKFDVYQNTLEYLISPNIHLKHKTFDERVAFLINLVSGLEMPPY